MLHLRLVVPPDRCEEVFRYLVGQQSATNVVRLRDAAVRPAGDLVQCDVAREAASAVLADLRDLGLQVDGSIAVEEIDVSLSEVAEEAERQAPGLPVDAVVWEEVEARTMEESSLSATYLVFMTVATMIAAFGVLLDQPILVVGAMVVGPEFGPLAGLCVATVQRRGREAKRSLTALLVGFPVGIVLTMVLTWALTGAGLLQRSMLTSDRPLTAFIYHPDALSFVVAFLAGVAGTVSLTAAKSGALIGVLISVATVPSAANAAVALAYGVGHEALGSLGQLGLNLAGIVAAGLLTLTVQRLAWHLVQQRAAHRVARRPAG